MKLLVVLLCLSSSFGLSNSYVVTTTTTTTYRQQRQPTTNTVVGPLFGEYEDYLELRSKQQQQQESKNTDNAASAGGEGRPVFPSYSASSSTSSSGLQPNNNTEKVEKEDEVTTKQQEPKKNDVVKESWLSSREKVNIESKIIPDDQQQSNSNNANVWDAEIVKQESNNKSSASPVSAATSTNSIDFSQQQQQTWNGGQQQQQQQYQEPSTMQSSATTSTTTTTTKTDSSAKSGVDTNNIMNPTPTTTMNNNQPVSSSSSSSSIPTTTMKSSTVTIDNESMTTSTKDDEISTTIGRPTTSEKTTFKEEPKEEETNMNDNNNKPKPPPSLLDDTTVLITDSLSTFTRLTPTPPPPKKENNDNTLTTKTTTTMNNYFTTEINNDNTNTAIKKTTKMESKPKPKPKPTFSTVGMTERIMKKVAKEAQATGAGGTSTYEGFLKAEENWKRLKEMKPIKSNNVKKILPTSQIFVTEDAVLGNDKCWQALRKVQNKQTELDYDVIVCGGTLGIFFATALQLHGHNVCVIEAGPLRGREQEWNISMDELLELVELGILSHDDIDAAIKTEFPACRSGFKNEEVTPLTGGYFENDVGYECVTPDVLNLGVAPAVLLERVAEKFQILGGTILEKTRLNGVVVSQTVGTALDLGEENDPLTSRLVIDCMGNASPISRQQRYGLKPDGICAVVGCCAGGYDPKTNVQGDIIYTLNPIQDKGENGKLQYFWEAFPVGIGRNGKQPGTSDVKTTYMFTYMDADERRPSLETLFEDYWKLLPVYQPSITNPEEDLDVKRVLFAYFPTYTDSPIKPQFDRILPVGDASGIQSPLSFGGFGALTRHLGRISSAVDEALTHDLLTKEYLGEINAYTPNLSAAWMFQKAMSVKVGQRVDEKFVNRLLAVNFENMDMLGQRTIKPFLQDVIRFDGLVSSLALSFVSDPLFMPQIVAHIGLPRLVDWLGHVAMMGSYDFLHKFVSPVARSIVDRKKDPAERYLWRRRLDAWKYGSGNDYKLPKRN